MAYADILVNELRCYGAGCWCSVRTDRTKSAASTCTVDVHVEGNADFGTLDKAPLGGMHVRGKQSK